MKVLLVNDWPVEAGGGAERYTLDIHNELRKAGHSSFILAGQVRGRSLEQKEDRCYIPYLNSGPLRKNIFAHLLRTYQALQRVGTIINTYQPDIVHFQNLLNPIVIRYLRKKLPTVDTVHDCRPFCSKPPPDVASRVIGKSSTLCNIVFSASCFRRCYFGSFGNIHKSRLLNFVENVSYFPFNYLALNETLQIDRLICVSDYLRRLALRCGAREEAVLVLPNFTRYDLDDDDPPIFREPQRILYIGRLTPEKGIFCFLESIKSLPNDVEIEIAGDGPQADKVGSICKELEARGKTIELVGFLDKVELRKSLKRCQFVVFPSIGAEGCPLVGIEALTFRKPVVGFDVPGIGEWLIDGVTGLFAEYGNAQDLARKMQLLLDNPRMVELLGKNGKALIRRKFSKEVHLSKLIDTYKYISRLREINPSKRL